MPLSKRSIVLKPWLKFFNLQQVMISPESMLSLIYSKHEICLVACVNYLGLSFALACYLCEVVSYHTIMTYPCVEISLNNPLIFDSV